MAVNLEKADQTTTHKGTNPQVSELDTDRSKKAIFNLKKSGSKDKDSKSSFERFHFQRASKSLATHPLAESSTQVASQKYQPSKVFAQKCLTELQLVLDTVKVDYHEEIKKLYTGEDRGQHTDLQIRIGQTFERSVHKCIIASRAYKFYSALKLFRKPEEKHIIVSQLQTHSIDKEGSKNKTGELLPEELTVKQLKEKQSRESLEFLECNLPEDLIETGSLLGFIRCAYSDRDLIGEEIQLNRLLLGWLKLNRPDLMHTNNNKSTKIQADYRESFRTIQPDIERLTLTVRADSLTTDGLPSYTDSFMKASDYKMESQRESVDETSQVASLTRTETFELLSKNDNNLLAAPTGLSSNPSVTDYLTDDDESRRQTANDSEASEAYAPTTRTGLKPKKFTTPVGLKSAKPTTPAPSPSGDTSVTRISTVNRVGITGKSSPTVRRPKCSGNSDSTPPQKTSEAVAKPKTSTPLSKVSKPGMITRAHPISLERSQSPATVAITRVKPKNFIAVNKKFVSQIEKKVASATGTNQGSPAQKPATPVGNYDSENETSDTSFLATEPLTADNLASQLDRFTLVSYSKLAEALSKMFIGEILTDSIILVNGGNKQINAHKCILAARSAYLNDIIGQKNLPSITAGSTASEQLQPLKIDLSDYSYAAVYFSIMHIYSGIVKVPDDLELEEFAKLSHLLHIGTLRQVCIHNLRMNYCHYFHKPCSVCCVGVLKTLPLAWRYDYTELYSKCLQWIGSHFAQIFCLEEFSNLKPHDLIEECYRSTLSQLTPDNVIQKTIECQKLLKSLPRVKWTESIICLVGRQLEDFCLYVAENYEKILQSESFLALGNSCWECEVLEENLLAAMNHLKPDSGCRTLTQLDKIECSIEPMSRGFSCNEDGSTNKNVSETFANLIAKMRKYCERYLLKEAAAVVHCASWRQMHPSLQRRIKDQALLSTDFDEPTKSLAAKPKLPSTVRQQGSRMCTSSPQPRFTSGASSPSNKTSNESASKMKSPNATYLPPPKNKTATARHVKVLK